MRERGRDGEKRRSRDQVKEAVLDE